MIRRTPYDDAIKAIQQVLDGTSGEFLGPLDGPTAQELLAMLDDRQALLEHRRKWLVNHQSVGDLGISLGLPDHGSELQRLHLVALYEQQFEWAVTANDPALERYWYNQWHVDRHRVAVYN